MTNLIVIVIGLHIIIAFLYATIISYKILLTNINSISDNKLVKIIKDRYAKTAAEIAILIFVGLYFIMINKLLSMISINNVLINEYISIIIAIILGSLLLILISFIPFLKVAEKRANIILTGFRKLVLFFKIILFPISFIYLLFFDLFYKPEDSKMTEEELLELVEKAQLEEGINENESQLIKRVLHFDELKVLDIYTPRVELVVIEEGMSNDEIISLFKTSGYSRLPLYKDNIDEIYGIINHKDFYNLVVIENSSLSSIIQTPVEVTEYMEVTNLLAMLKKNKAHMAIVKDEYGGTLGVVTMEDILEELVGDIWDEHDNVIESIRQVDANKYLVKGSAYLSDLINKLQLVILDADDYVTVNGWVISKLGKIGVVGNKFTFQNLSIKIINADDKKVLEILIERKVD